MAVSECGIKLADSSRAANKVRKYNLNHIREPLNLSNQTDFFPVNGMGIES